MSEITIDDVRKRLTGAYAHQLEDIVLMCEADPLYLEALRPQLIKVVDFVVDNPPSD